MELRLEPSLILEFQMTASTDQANKGHTPYKSVGVWGEGCGRCRVGYTIVLYIGVAGGWLEAETRGLP